MPAYRPSPESAKLDDSAPPSPSEGHCASGPGAPIAPGPSSFRARYLVMWFGFFALVWLAGASGCTMLDL